MNYPHLYRRFNLLRLGGIPPPKPVGGFVVGVPTKDVRTFQTENPTVAIDGVFLKLVSAEEFDEVRADSRSGWEQILNINNPDIRRTRKR
jgi:hypothetical protein